METHFFLTRVLGHLLDRFRLTIHTYTYEATIQSHGRWRRKFFWRVFRATCFICSIWATCLIYLTGHLSSQISNSEIDGLDARSEPPAGFIQISAIWRSRKTAKQIFRLSHLLDILELTVDTCIFGSAIQRLTKSGNAIFLNTRSGPPAWHGLIDMRNVYLRIGNSEIDEKWECSVFRRAFWLEARF